MIPSRAIERMRDRRWLVSVGLSSLLIALPSKLGAEQPSDATAEHSEAEQTSERDESVEVISHDSTTSESEDSDSETSNDDHEDDSKDDDEVEVISHGSDRTSEDASTDEAGDRSTETIRHDTSSDEPPSSESNSSERSTSVMARAQFQGQWGAAAGIDTNWQSNEDVAEWRADLSLQLEYDLSSSWRAVLSGEFSHWAAGRERQNGPNLLVNAAEPRASFEARLGESYALYRSDRWTFRAGYLVTSWGSTTLVRPGDVINPVDATDLSVTGDRSTLPQLAAEVGYVAPDWSLEAVVVPFFRPNRLTVFGRDTAIAVPQNPLVGEQFPIVSLFDRIVDRSLYEELQPLLLSTSVPDETPRNASVGARWTVTQWNTDVGLGYYFGWDRTPWLEVDDDLQSLATLIAEDGRVLEDFDVAGFIGRNPEVLDLTDRLSERARQGEDLLTSEYRRRHSLVLDISRYIGPIGVRADVTVSPERTFATRNFESIRRTTIFGALGLSYERLVDGRPLTVTLEGYGLRPLPRDSSVNQWLVSEGELGPDDAQPVLIGTGLYGLAGALQWGLPIWKLQLRLGGLADLSNGDVIVGGQLERRWTSWLKTGLGAILYEGPPPEEELSIGGLYDRNDQIQLIVGGSF